ncbi:MAG: ABC transporter ATP-binding protein [Acutalibacteraceae bacterium]|nr:ABC transporter ATP-binding protein [Acutalibacteraceae bacterium]
MNKNTSTAQKLISGSIKAQLGRIILSSFLSSLVSVIYIALALISKQIIDIASGHTEGKLLPFGIAVIVLIAVQVICSALQSRLRVSTSGLMAVLLRKKLYHTVFSKNLSDVEDYHTGDLLNRFSSDVDTVVNTASSIIPAIASIISKIVSGAVAILLIDWKFAAGLICLGVAVPALCRIIGHKYRYLHTKHQESEGRVKAFLQESFANLKIIKSFSSLLPVNKKLDKLQKENYSLKLKRNNLNIIYTVGLYSFFTLGYFLVLLWGAAGIQRNIVSYGSLLAFLQIISQLRGPLQSVSGIIPSYQAMLSSAQRISEISELSDEIHSLDKPVIDTIKNVFTCINAESLSFSYEEKPILKNCSFSLKRGTVTSVTGESGVGKSTLFSLLLGYNNASEGRLSFDGKYEINASTRSLFAYVPQGNMILSGTIKENITLCTTDKSEERLISAIKVAQLYDWIESLPDGINTYIGENGLGVSEGQAQRIAIARAIMCDTPVLLLDEATSALDSQTELRLLSAIKELSDKTVIMVTHRATPKGICDVHIHLEEGFIKEINQ